MLIYMLQKIDFLLFLEASIMIDMKKIWQGRSSSFIMSTACSYGFEICIFGGTMKFWTSPDANRKECTDAEDD